MEDVRAGDIAVATGGRLLCGDPMTPIKNISIDSRVMKGDDLFVPIIGEKVDAHRFIPAAIRAGAAATLTSEDEEKEDDFPWIRVGNTVEALQALGTWLRRRLHMPVIGVTGSVGKTTTREMIAAALSAGKKVYTTGGNSNGQLGVPLVISEADPSADVAVVEMGMSLPGEMARIAAVAQPTIGVISNIGVSHIENLGSREEICREKMHIADYLGPDGRMILNGDDDILSQWRGTTRFRTLFFGQKEGNDYRATDIRFERGGTHFTCTAGGRHLEVSLAVPGTHNVSNALCALAVADVCGVGLEKAAEKLAAFHGFEGRLQIRERDGCTYIDDTYNASPDSMRAALRVLAELPAKGRRIAVLADMLELGKESAAYHEQVGEAAAQLDIDCFFLIGELAQNIGRALTRTGRSVVLCENNAQAVRQLRRFIRQGDVILLKGSRGMHVEEVLRDLTQGKAGDL